LADDPSFVMLGVSRSAMAGVRGAPMSGGVPERSGDGDSNDESGAGDDNARG
jgi:hypothetical protein